MKALHMVSFTLLVVGGLNWLLTAFGWNVVNMALGGWPMVEKLVYVLVGLSAIWEVVNHKKNCKMCGMDRGMGGGMPTMR
ncbi:MAG: DUF378 domain-containing protein [Patescibacteria group bacterium]